MRAEPALLENATYWEVCTDVIRYFDPETGLSGLDHTGGLVIGFIIDGIPLIFGRLPGPLPVPWTWLID